MLKQERINYETHETHEKIIRTGFIDRQINLFMRNFRVFCVFRS